MKSYIKDVPAAAKLTGTTSQPGEEGVQSKNTTRGALLAGCSDVMKTDEAGAVLGISPATVRDLCRQGKLPFFRLGKQIRIPKTWLLDFINNGGAHDDSL